MTDTTRKSIKVINASLDEVMRDGQPDIVLRGVIHPDSLRLLQVAEYQRETLSDQKIGVLMKAIQTSRVPDIDLGMRGMRCTGRDDAYYLQDSVFIIDGFQRVTAAMMLMNQNPDLTIHLGAMINFNTNEVWERKRFEALNLGQTKLSPNVTLRNQQHKFTVAKALFDLSYAKGFPLADKVTWSQNVRKGELATATTLFKTVGFLHSHVGPGRSGDVISLCVGLQKIMDNLGAEILTANTMTFFNVVDECWGIRNVYHRSRESTTQLRVSFLKALAMLFSEHLDFWRKDRLVVDVKTIQKLKQFPVQDPNIKGLSSSSGQATEMLLMMLIRHVNSGRRSGLMRPRRPVEEVRAETSGDADE